jgi:thioredoxin:protein disulfide reductase
MRMLPASPASPTSRHRPAGGPVVARGGGVVHSVVLSVVVAVAVAFVVALSGPLHAEAARADAAPEGAATAMIGERGREGAPAELPAAAARGPGEPETEPCAEIGAAPPPALEDDSLSGRVKGALAAGNLLVALLLVLGGGLLTALSPCVYPLIPITLSILGARQASTHLKGFLLSATYVSGMVLLYSALGVGFAAAGFLAGSALQSPLVTVGVALLCILMAASMFGAFEFALPSGLQTRLAQAGGSGFKGAFVMGLVAGVIAAPCTGPVLSFILTLIARDGDMAKGALLMVFYALGMGLPFLVLGTFSQAIARMPKSGRWMEAVKSIFGLLMLGAGLYYLRLGFPALGEALDPLGQSGWLGPLLLAVGVALGALHLSFKMSSAADKARKAVGVAFSTLGLLAFVAWANTGPAPDAGGGAPSISWTVVKDEPDAGARFDAALAAAKAQCRPVMIDFFAEWCVACKELDHRTYPDAAVREEAQRFTSVKIDATNESAGLEELQKRFHVVGLPTIVFVDSRGRVLEEPRVTGFVEAPAYARLMQRVR